MTTETLTWAQLGTTAGASVIAAALTQILKQYFSGIDPKWIALFLSLLCMIGYQLIVAGDYTPGAYILSVLNAVMSAGMSIGAYEAFISPVAHKEGGE